MPAFLISHCGLGRYEPLGKPVDQRSAEQQRQQKSRSDSPCHNGAAHKEQSFIAAHESQQRSEHEGTKHKGAECIEPPEAGKIDDILN
ncbi:hypothetical protein D3C72_2044400 [compost metagenome]